VWILFEGRVKQLILFYPVEIPPVFKGSQRGNAVSNRLAIHKELIFLVFIETAQFCSNVLKARILQPEKPLLTELSTGFSHMLWIVAIHLLL